MKQKEIKGLAGLGPASEAAAAGAAQLGQAIGLKQNDEAAIRQDKVALETAVTAYQQARPGLNQKRAVGRSVTKSSAEFLRLTRDVLKTRLGKKYSQAWDVTGFVGSLRVPVTLVKVQNCLQMMQAYLTANPEVQVAQIDVTDVRGQGLLNSLNTAVANINSQKTVVGDLKIARDTAAQKVRDRLSGLFHELEQLIGPLDQRWKTFGFNLPGADATPDIPGNVTAVLIGPTAVSVKWTATPRAEHYRVWKKVTGVDEDFVNIGSPADLDFTMETLPSNATVEIAISAVNNGGESARSQTVSVVTH